jgi:hypothetical protein
MFAKCEISSFSINIYIRKKVDAKPSLNRKIHVVPTIYCHGNHLHTKPVNVHVQRQTTNLNVMFGGAAESPLATHMPQQIYVHWFLIDHIFLRRISVVSRTKRGGFFTIWLAAKHFCMMRTWMPCRVFATPPFDKQTKQKKHRKESKLS